MALFKRKHLNMILKGEKTQARRTHKGTWKLGKIYSIRDRWFAKGEAHILITRKFRERLVDISHEDVQKEGYNNIWQFQ